MIAARAVPCGTRRDSAQTMSAKIVFSSTYFSRLVALPRCSILWDVGLRTGATSDACRRLRVGLP
jgi:hypothetical protein